MQKKWLSLLAVPVVALTAMSLLSAGAPQRDGARLLDQVMARLQREAIDSISQDEIYERAARGLVRQIDDPYAALFSPDELTVQMIPGVDGCWSADVDGDAEVSLGEVQVAFNFFLGVVSCF